MYMRVIKRAACGALAWGLVSLATPVAPWAQSAFVEWQVRNAQRNLQLERARAGALSQTIQQLDQIAERTGHEAQNMAVRVNSAYLSAQSTFIPSIEEESATRFGSKAVDRLSEELKRRATTKIAAAVSGVGTVGTTALEVLDVIGQVVEYREAMGHYRELKRIQTLHEAGQVLASTFAAERRAELRDVQDKIAALNRTLERVQTSGGGIESAKGVRIHFDDRILARALGRFDDAGTNADFAGMQKALYTGTDPEEIHSAFRQAADKEKARFIRETKKTVTVSNVVLVSLNAVARSNRHRPSTEVRELAGITRIYGFVLVAGSKDVVLVGGVDPGVPPIGLDNLVTALKAVWKAGNVPTVSLDPDPSSPFAPQIVRVGGIPKDSRFAKIMLDADYDAKRILMADPTLRVNVRGFRNIVDILRSMPASERGALNGRIWLTPEQPEEGEIQVSNDQHVVVYETGVRVLTEELQWAGRIQVGTGRIHSASQGAVDSFTEYYAEFERQRPVFRQLHGLFDLVMLAKALRQMVVESDALVQLASIQLPDYPVPDTYKAFMSEHVVGGRLMGLGGGVVTHSFVGPRHRLHYDAQTMSQLREEAAALSQSGHVAAPAAGVRLTLVVPSGRRRFYVEGLRSMVRGEHAKAERWFTRLIEDDPHFGEAYVERALALFNIGKRQEARADLDQAIALIPDDRMLRIIHFLSLIEEGRKPEDIDMAQEVRADLASFALREARSFFAAGKGTEAFTKSNLALALNPKDADALTFRAWLKLQAGDLEAALADADRAIKLAPRFASAYTVRGIAGLRLGPRNEEFYEDAFEDLSKAVALEPKVPEWWFNRAKVLEVWGNRRERDLDLSSGYAAAIDHYTGLIEKRRDLALLYVRRGTAKVRAGRIGDGVKDFDAAIEKDPRLALAFIERAQARHSLQQYEGALADAEAAVRLEPTVATGFAARCAALYKLGRSDAAIRDCDHAIRLDGGSGYAYHIRALIKRDQGDHAGARRDWQQAQDVDPGNKGFYQQLIDMVP